MSARPLHPAGPTWWAGLALAVALAGCSAASDQDASGTTGATSSSGSSASGSTSNDSSGASASSTGTPRAPSHETVARRLAPKPCGLYGRAVVVAVTCDGSAVSFRAGSTERRTTELGLYPHLDGGVSTGRGVAVVGTLPGSRARHGELALLDDDAADSDGGGRAGAVRRIDLGAGNSPTGLAWSKGAGFRVVTAGGSLLRVAATGAVQTQRTDLGHPVRVAMTDSAVWVLGGDGTVRVLDAAGRTVAPARRVADSYRGVHLAAVGDVVWITTPAGGLTRLSASGKELPAPAGEAADGGSDQVRDKVLERVIGLQDCGEQVLALHSRRSLTDAVTPIGSILTTTGSVVGAFAFEFGAGYATCTTSGIYLLDDSGDLAVQEQ